MRGWLVIHPTERPRVIIGGPNGTDVGDVDSKLVVHNSTDYLSPYLRLKASFRMNGASFSNLQCLYHVETYALKKLRRAGRSKGAQCLF